MFPAPIRPMLGASSHQDACAIGRTIEGRGLTLQAWNIAPKISEVDQLLRESPGYRGVVREVHPEVSFSLLNGAPIVLRKSRSPGRAIRRALLEPIFGENLDLATRDCRSQGAKPDDVLDAFVALWTANRILLGNHRSFPMDPQSDRFGLAMEILA